MSYRSGARRDPGGLIGVRREPGGRTGARRDPGGLNGARREPGGRTGALPDPGGLNGARREPGGRTGALPDPGGPNRARRDPGGPVGSCIYWMFARTSAALSGVSVASAAWHTAFYSAAAAALSTLIALPLALLAVRHPGRARRLLERSTYLVLAAPGLVIALALSYFSERYAGGIGYHSQALLIIAYAVLFFPLALTGVRASVTQAPVTFDEAARALGQRRLAVLRRVTLPIVMPGLAAAFCLVFLSGVTELTATLILIPTGVQTLATQFWAYQQNLSYGQAAPFALVIIAVAAVPSYVMGRWFDRLPKRSEKLS